VAAAVVVVVQLGVAADSRPRPGRRPRPPIPRAEARVDMRLAHNPLAVQDDPAASARVASVLLDRELRDGPAASARVASVLLDRVERDDPAASARAASVLLDRELRDGPAASAPAASLSDQAARVWPRVAHTIARPVR
jgi:hypothetical protein